MKQHRLIKAYSFNLKKVSYILICSSMIACTSMEKKILQEAETGNFTLTNDSSNVEFQVFLPYKKITPKDEKTYYWYKNKAIHLSEGDFSGKVLHGKYTSYYLTGELKEKGSYVYGLKDGIWKEFEKNGKIKREEKFKDGKLKKDKSFFKSMHLFGSKKKQKKENNITEHEITTKKNE